MKKAEEPPTPPPRPQKTHSRASSLDLNKLFQQGAPGTIHIYGLSFFHNISFPPHMLRAQTVWSYSALCNLCYCVLFVIVLLSWENKRGNRDKVFFYCSVGKVRSPQEFKPVSNFEYTGGLSVKCDSWEQHRNIVTVDYSLVKFHLDFRGEKWMAATSSSPPSETINLPGEPCLIMAAVHAYVHLLYIKQTKPLFFLWTPTVCMSHKLMMKESFT